MVWGATAEEAARPYPADTLLDGPVLLATRAVGVDAPTSTVYRWLCQVAVAPYSYDWLDNLGRRSPRQLTPGADDLHVGKAMMVFVRDRFRARPLVVRRDGPEGPARVRAGRHHVRRGARRRVRVTDRVPAGRARRRPC